MHVNFFFVFIYFFPDTEEMSEIQPVHNVEMWYREKVLLSL